MPRLFFLLSGEYETLPSAELTAILQAEDIAYEVRGKLPQVIRVSTATKACEAVKRRAALVRVCCRELLCCQASTGKIEEAARGVSFRDFIQSGERFAVRVRRVGEFARDLPSVAVERLIGASILRAVKGAAVDLESPHWTFFGVLTGGRFLLGLKLADVSPTPFIQRRPRNRAFFHPSAMPAKLARCMVNLARPRSGDLLLDPFCGAGSFLIEAGLLGCRVLGFDAKRRMANGCLKNLKAFHIAPEGVMVADAKNLPLTTPRCVVTDPPYGRSASTFGSNTRTIVEDFLAEWSAIARKGALICIASPKTVRIGEIAQTHKIKHVESHLVYVHRSLTREIAVLEKR